MTLSPLDRILVAMDHPQRPSNFNFAAIFHLRNTPAPESLRTGARSARLRYPATGATLDTSGQHWQPSKDLVNEVAVLPDSDKPSNRIEEFIDSAFSPFREAPIQQALAFGKAGGESLLATRAHHAAADGTSLSLWLCHQFRVAAGLEDPLSRSGPTTPVACRSHPAPVRKSRRSAVGPSQPLWTARTAPGLTRRWLTVEIPGAIDADALAARALATIVEWNRRHDARHRSMSLWMPVNIRRRDDRSFGNGTSRIRVYADSAAALPFPERCRDVRRQILRSLRHGEWAIPEMPWLARLMPAAARNRLIRAYLNRPWVDMGSVVFSYIPHWNGCDDPAFDDVAKIDLVGQLHERHPLAINGIAHGGKTWMTFTYDPARLTLEDVQQLANLYQFQATA